MSENVREIVILGALAIVVIACVIFAVVMVLLFYGAVIGTFLFGIYAAFKGLIGMFGL